MDISILIPVYNSAPSLPFLYEEIRQYLDGLGVIWEVVFVDDASGEETQKVLRSLKDANNRIKIRTLQKNVGQQKALYLGLQRCQGRHVLTMDDDLQHDIRHLPELLKSSQEGADLVFGIYENYGASFWRTWGSRQIGQFFRRRFPQLQGNKVSSYRLIHRRVYENLPLRPPPFVYLSAELIPQATKIANVSIKRRKRPHGRSGHGFWKCVGIACKLYFYYGL